MAKRGRSRRDDGKLDMTPMIDIVFQLIIFFIVTMVITKDVNPDIVLPPAPNAPEIDLADTTLVVEVNQNGWISIHGVQLSEAQLRTVVQRRFDVYGEFPVVIRGDHRARHKHIKNVMDLVSGIGLWKINFVAIKELKKH
ncbi:MAG: biopolymer transporter ExbD [Verrucomicrobia bacterium]|nr:biopolymer transporter ExbD [Verrucomicrobiota bacterium]